MAQAKAVLEQLQSGIKNIKPLQMAWFQTDPNDAPKLIADYEMPAQSGKGFTRLTNEQAIESLKKNVNKQTGLSEYDRLLQSGDQDEKSMLSSGSAVSSKYVNFNGVMYGINSAAQLANATPEQIKSELSLMGTRQQETAKQAVIDSRVPTKVLQQSDGTFAVTDTSGKVLKGGFANEAQALATQNQITGGSTPTLSGRPDVFAVQPTQAEVDAGIQPVVPQAGMAPVNPKVAELGDIQALQAGTLPTPKAEAQAKITDPVSGETFDTTFTGESSNVHVDVPTEFSTGDLKDAFSNPVTNSDFQSMITQITAAQQAYIESIKPSTETVGLQTQLADIRAKADVVTQSLMEGVADIEGQPIPMQFITGQASALEKRANIKLNSLARLEANLLENLGISVSQDQARQAAAEQNYSFTKENANLMLEIQDRVQAQEDKVFAKAESLKKDSRDILASMLESFSGYSFDDLSPDAQKQLSNLAVNSGIPLGLLVEGMDSVKNQTLLKSVSDRETQVVSSGGRQMLIDSQTGDVIKVIGTSGGGAVSSGVGGAATVASEEEVKVTKNYNQLSQVAKSVVDGVLKLSDLTPTQKAIVGPELNAYGYKSALDLTPTQQQTVADLDTIIGLADKVKDYSGDGTLEGVGPVSGSAGAFISGIFGTGTEEAKSVRALVGNIRGTIAKLRGGTSFTVNEEKLLNSYTPATTDNSVTLLNKLGLLQEFLQNSKSNLIKVTQPSRGNVDISDIKF